MTKMLLYLHGYRRMQSEDDEDAEVWFKQFVKHEDDDTVLRNVRLLTSMWRTDDEGVPVVEPALFGRACFWKDGHAFIIDYDASWSIDEIERHALAVAKCAV